MIIKNHEYKSIITNGDILEINKDSSKKTTLILNGKISFTNEELDTLIKLLNHFKEVNLMDSQFNY